MTVVGEVKWPEEVEEEGREGPASIESRHGAKTKATDPETDDLIKRRNKESENGS